MALNCTKKSCTTEQNPANTKLERIINFMRKMYEHPSVSSAFLTCNILSGLVSTFNLFKHRHAQY